MYMKRWIWMFLCFSLSFSAEAGRRNRNNANRKAVKDAALGATRGLIASTFVLKFEEVERIYGGLTQSPRVNWWRMAQAQKFDTLLYEGVHDFQNVFLAQLELMQNPDMALTELQAQFLGRASDYLSQFKIYLLLAADMALTKRPLRPGVGNSVLISAQLAEAFSFLQLWMTFSKITSAQIKKVVPAHLKAVKFSYDEAAHGVKIVPQIGDIFARVALLLQTEGALSIRTHLTRSMVKGKEGPHTYFDVFQQFFPLVAEPAIGRAEFDGDQEMYRMRLILMTGYWKTLFLSSEAQVEAQIEETRGLLLPYLSRVSVTQEMILQAAWAVQLSVGPPCAKDMDLNSLMQNNLEEMRPAENIFTFYSAVKTWVDIQLPELVNRYQALAVDEEALEVLLKKKDFDSMDEERWFKHCKLIESVNIPFLLAARKKILARRDVLQTAIQLLSEADLVVAEEIEDEQFKQVQAKKAEEKRVQREKLEAKEYEAFCQRKQAKLAEEFERLKTRDASSTELVAPEPEWKKAQRDAILLRYTYGDFQQGLLAFRTAQAQVLQANVPKDTLEVSVGMTEYLLSWLRTYFYDDALKVLLQIESEIEIFRTKKVFPLRSEVEISLRELTRLEQHLQCSNVVSILQDALATYEVSLRFPYSLWKEIPGVEMTEKDFQLLMAIPQLLKRWPELIAQWKQCRVEYMAAKRESNKGEVYPVSHPLDPLVFPTFEYLQVLSEEGAKLEALHAKRGFRSDYVPPTPVVNTAE